MNETAIYSCSICESDSRDICVACTKDACPNHLCLRCRRCSDCCVCEMPRTAATVSTQGSTPTANNGYN